jgi:hypothetical protein
VTNANPYFDAFSDIEGSTLKIALDRDVEAQASEGLGMSFSEGAMQDLHMQLMTWVGTRMLRFAEDNGVMPQTMTVKLNVDLTA